MGFLKIFGIYFELPAEWFNFWAISRARKESAKRKERGLP